jgi:hypothetical protein
LRSQSSPLMVFCGFDLHGALELRDGSHRPQPADGLCLYGGSDESQPGLSYVYELHAALGDCANSKIPGLSARSMRGFARAVAKGPVGV